MKTALFLSCLLLGGSLIPSHSARTETSAMSYMINRTKKMAASPVAPVKIIIDKSDYELQVYDAQGWYATYPVVFGNNTLEDKKMEGDRKTPEGNFRIVAKRPHNKWSRFLAIDYPTRESIERFNQRKQRGEVPAHATVGGGVGIHGTWPHEDFVVDRFNNWTNGCIALKRKDVEELYSYIPVGTPVTIKK